MFWILLFIFIDMATQKWKDSNKEKMRKYRREWYYLNKEHAISKIKERQKNLQVWLDEKKKTLKCERCGMNHVACLHFHHIDPRNKESSLAKVARKGWSIKKIEQEIAKCKVLCANCHSILHWEERQ